MKPPDWNELSKEEKFKRGILLFSSLRGQYIISQALCVAIKTLKKVKKPYREESNIQDMEILLETIFPLYKGVKEAEMKVRHSGRKKRDG